MCGIIAGIYGNYIKSKNLINMIYMGLFMIQNRGYDSVGICSINQNNNFTLKKIASSVSINGIDEIKKHIELFNNDDIIIGHTRWATHGKKTDNNAHPHIDYYNNFSLVHNGIIENYMELKQFLINNDFKFISETDTEIIVNLISYYYNIFNDVKISINEALNKIKGTFALVIMCIKEPNTLYCIRKGSPLLISYNEEFALIASEKSGFCNYVNNYISINNNDLCVLKKYNDKIIFETNNDYIPTPITETNFEFSPKPYPYWVIKEIMEQSEASLRAISYGGRLLDDNKVKLGGLESHKNELMEIDNLILLGCGTSYHACLMGTYYFKELCNFNVVLSIDGSEFNYHDIPKNGKSGVIFLSQSGETKDLHRCLELCNDLDILTIGVVNVPDSLIARETLCGCYLNGGREVSVASTKSYTSQVILLSMIAIWFSQNKNINIHKRTDIINELRRLNIDIENTINKNIDIAKEIAQYLINYESLFILGKGICDSSAKEGSLKIKEVGYIHAESYSSSALKHGPYSLIQEGFPIILLCPDDNYFDKNISVSEEIKSRLAYTIGITNNTLNYHTFDKVLYIEKNYYFRGLLSVIPMQLIAYEIALLKGHNPDMLRGLAKCVTVD